MSLGPEILLYRVNILGNLYDLIFSAIETTNIFEKDTQICTDENKIKCSDGIFIKHLNQNFQTNSKACIILLFCCS